MFDIDWVGLLVPLSYLSILIGSLATFSSLYRKRKLARSATLEPWFPPHLQRNIYLSLLHLDPADPSSTPAHADRSLSNVPDSIIKAALMRRAVEDIHRIIQIRNSKPALQGLLQRGSVGDELWQRFQRAEKEIEEEVKDVVSEANALAPGWGQIIFQSANEIANNELARRRMAEIQAELPQQKEWWDRRKENISSGFMKELDEEREAAKANSGATATTAATTATTPTTPTTTTTPASRKGSVVSAAGGVKANSDDDAVLVEAGGPAAETQGQAPGSAKKKKAARN